MRWARTVAPRKTAQAISSWTGLQQRQAESLLGGHSGMSADALRRLLRSEHGFDVLRILIEESGEPVPPWWADFRHMVLAADLEARIAAERQRLRQLKRQRIGIRRP